MRCRIWYHMYNLKNVKNTHGAVLLQPATLLKVTLFHGCFSRFLKRAANHKHKFLLTSKQKRAFDHYQ